MHGLLALGVVLGQVVFYHGLQLRHVDLLVHPGVRSGHHEVRAEHLPARGPQLGPLQRRVGLHLLLQHAFQPALVLVADEAVAEDARVLVHPQAAQLHASGDLAAVHHQHALERLGDVSHVERVVGLGGRGAQFLQDGVVQLDGGFDQTGAVELHLLLERPQEVGQDGGEDESERVVRHVYVVDDVEVPVEAGRHVVAPAPGGPAGHHEYHIDDPPELQRLAVIPAHVVEPLAQDLDGRLRAVLLLHGHIDVVHEDDELLARRGPVHALAALLRLRVDQVLRLVGRRLRGEGYGDGDVLVGEAVLQMALDVYSLSGSGGPGHHDVLLVLHEDVEQEGVADGVLGGDDQLGEGQLWVVLVRGDRAVPLDPRLRIHVVLEVVHRARHGGRLGHPVGRHLQAQEVVEGLAGCAPDRAAERPNKAEDKDGLELPLEGVDLLGGLLLPPVVHLVKVCQEGVKQVQQRLHEAVVRGGQGLGEVAAQVGEHARYVGVEELHQLGARAGAQGGRRGGEPALHQHVVAERGGLHVDHAAARHGGGRGHRQVLGLEHHRHGLAEGDDLARGEAELLVVVQDCVHVLDPDGIHRPVEEHPLQHRRVVLDAHADDHAQNAVLPLVRVLVELAVELPHADGLRIQVVDLGLLVPLPRDPLGV
mmetsp:Transcript_8240/g.18063  ORF Transcript_8240/g.18063 Transcript_8240/m.18063 type:complete len:649 (-) Transcript_8240:407-2353(-)